MGFSTLGYSVEKLDTEQYVQLQNCTAAATDTTDGGSYERFCINQYLDIKKNTTR